MQRFRGGLVFKAHRLCASLNSRLASTDEEEEDTEEEDEDATSAARATGRGNSYFDGQNDGQIPRGHHGRQLQGYLAHSKMPTTLGLP